MHRGIVGSARPGVNKTAAWQDRGWGFCWQLHRRGYNAEVIPEAEQQWLDEAQAQLLAGDLGGAQRLIERAGYGLLAKHEYGQATTTLLSAARLAILGKQGVVASKILSEVEDAATQTGQLAALWHTRAELAHLQRQPSVEQQALQQVYARCPADQRQGVLQRLAELACVHDRPLQAAAYYEELIAARSSATQQAERARLWIERAACFLAAGQPEEAGRCLDEAETLLPSGNLNAPPERWEEVRARLMGQRAALSAQRGQWAEAIGQAEQGHRLAISAQDVATCLGISGLLVGIHQQRGEEVAAYDVLVRTQVATRALLGHAGEALLEPTMRAFTERLGPQFAAVRAAWERTRKR